MILVGGFGFSGVPTSLINAVRDRPELKDFTVVSNNAGMPGVGLGEYFTHAQCYDGRSCTREESKETKLINLS